MKVQKLTRFYLKGGFITCTLTEPTATGFIHVELEADREYPSEIYARDKEDNILEAHSVTFSITSDDFVEAAINAQVMGVASQDKELEELKKENAAFKAELKKYEGAQVIYGSPAPWTDKGQVMEVEDDGGLHRIEARTLKGIKRRADYAGRLKDEIKQLKKENEDLKGGWAVPKGTAFHAFAGLKEGALRKENAALKDENAALKDEIKQLYEALEGSEADLIEFGVRPSPRPGRPRGTRNHCGLCGEPGHNRRTCPSHPKTKAYGNSDGTFSALIGD